MKTIYVFLNNYTSPVVREKLSMFAGNYILGMKNIWKLEVSKKEFSTAINSLEYALAGNNVHIEFLENTALFTFNK